MEDVDLEDKPWFNLYLEAINDGLLYKNMYTDYIAPKLSHGMDDRRSGLYIRWGMDIYLAKYGYTDKIKAAKGGQGAYNSFRYHLYHYYYNSWKDVNCDPLEESIHSLQDVHETCNTTKEEATMSYAVETKVFIGSTDASEVSDDQIFRAITELEGEIEKLEKIKAKSSKLQDKIDGIRENIQDLVKYVDAR